MILPTMTPQELTKEIFVDWDSIIKTSFDRLALEYDKKRRRGRVPKGASFDICYEIKTGRKNKWIFILSKAPSLERYKGAESINICSLTYYYTPAGLRVFKIMTSGGLGVYNGHLFTRYKERLALELTDPLEIVKRFFIHNGYSTSKIVPKDGRELSITVCKEGLLLGELQQGGTWIVYKTFITKNHIRPDQDSIERELLSSLQKEIEAELYKKDFNRPNYEYKADIAKGITG